MSSTLVELDNLHTISHPYQPSPPYPGVDHQVAQTTDQSSLPAPVVVQPPEVSTAKAPQFQRYRQQVVCSSCKQEVVTKTQYRIGSGTWCMCCVVFFIGGFICCFIPFLMKSCKDVVHRCPECGAVLGRKALM